MSELGNGSTLVRTETSSSMLTSRFHHSSVPHLDQRVDSTEIGTQHQFSTLASNIWGSSDSASSTASSV